MRAWLMRELIHVERCKRNRRPLLYKKHVSEFPCMQETMARDEELIFRSCKLGTWNADGDRFHRVPSDLFEDVLREAVKRLTCSAKPRMYGMRYESDEVQRAECLVQIYIDKAFRLMKRRASVMHSVHALTLNFGVKFRQKLIENVCTLMRLLLVDDKEGGGGVAEFEKVKSSELGGMI